MGGALQSAEKCPLALLVGGGGRNGTHPLEPIGTTSRAHTTQASKVNELQMTGEGRGEIKLRMQVWSTTHNLPTRTTQQERLHLGEKELPSADDEEMRPQKL
ncbi:hypothetical protein PBY51_015209 [Eleginops maclovinus]|uniref:Uncharacterized protein n=1 Tax=Eleginops maclovinus TaxID=56733 RepID=A0AAN8A8D5_ELEMC|nr:hypothetical protein PBY51_015209 [Eleginops maclovinus]